MDNLRNDLNLILKEMKLIRESMVKEMKRTDLEFTSKKTRIQIRLEEPIKIGQNGAYIGLKSLYMYYSIPNISNKNNNFRYRVYNEWRDINLESGSYEIENIETRIQNQMKSVLFYDNSVTQTENEAVNIPLISIKPDFSTGKSIIEIPEDCELDFTIENSIGSVLGFDKKILKTGIHISDNLVNIMSINSLNVCCSIAQGSIVNGKASNRLFTFFPDVLPGEKINKEPNNIVYYPVVGNKIEKIKVELVDEDGHIIDNRGDEVTIILSLKYC
jgi:hypothetical protein